MGHVQIRGLSKDFTERRKRQRWLRRRAAELGESQMVLNQLDLEFLDGDFVCILGPSGCGKTTLIRILAGFESQSSGTVTIDGKEVAGARPDSIFVFQHGGLLPWMSVAQNVTLGLRRSSCHEDIPEGVGKYLELVELGGFGDHYPHELSGGMQRRAELARALAANPEILFMDEPFAGLDFLTRLKLREEVINMHALLKKTVVFITHDIDEALVMGDHLVVLGGQPATVRLSERLDAPHPRDLTGNARLHALRKDLHRSLGVHFAL